MPFYKREGDSLQAAPNYVHGPGFNLLAADHATYTYPVDGWYWFENLDAAMSSPLLRIPGAASVSKRQAELALLEFGMLDAVEAAIAASPRDIQISWNRATSIDRDNPLIASIAIAQLGLTEVQLDSLFALAATK